MLYLHNSLFLLMNINYFDLTLLEKIHDFTDLLDSGVVMGKRHKYRSRWFSPGGAGVKSSESLPPREEYPYRLSQEPLIIDRPAAISGTGGSLLLCSTAWMAWTSWRPKMWGGSATATFRRALHLLHIF